LCRLMSVDSSADEKKAIIHQEIRQTLGIFKNMKNNPSQSRDLRGPCCN
jgi:hypothetical protein